IITTEEIVNAKTVQEEAPLQVETTATETAAPAKELPATLDVWHFARREKKFDRPKRHKRPEKNDAAQTSNDNAQPQGERKHFDKKKPFDKDKPRRDKRPHGKDKGRGDGPREKQAERRLVFSTENKDKKVADPNNPFAALAALKSKMDEKAG
ncbi:MAG: hypothetical protein V4691_04880, partial [Pseudomonadota bacterium]